ncbi:hypothetical protein Hanom_Chr13g01193151 [Helianthus anomalus]
MSKNRMLYNTLYPLGLTKLRNSVNLYLTKGDFVHSHALTLKLLFDPDPSYLSSSSKSIRVLILLQTPSPLTQLKVTITIILMSPLFTNQDRRPAISETVVKHHPKSPLLPNINTTWISVLTSVVVDGARLHAPEWHHHWPESLPEI